MHHKVYHEFEQILPDQSYSHVLEVGATPHEHTLLTLPQLSGANKTGLNLVHGGEYDDFSIVEGNANDMTDFDDDMFDCILCNATFEHDKYFYKSLAEMRRVAASECVMAIGVPGYTKKYERSRGAMRFKSLAKKLAKSNDDNVWTTDVSDNTETTDSEPNRSLRATVERRLYDDLYAGWRMVKSKYPGNRETPVMVVHNEPGDYYRFSRQAMSEVLLEACQDKVITEVLRPPRIIGVGEYEPDG